MLEFIQNADDNKYYANVTPTLVMRLSTEDRRMEIQCNETGFGEGNVRAICSIGASTKTSQAGYIGAIAYHVRFVPSISLESYKAKRG